MPTKELPKGTFSAAGLAREVGIDPRFARARLRKIGAAKLPPVHKGDPHVHNEAWVFDNKHRAKILAAIKPTAPTKKDKVDKESTKAAKELASPEPDEDEEEDEEEEED